MKKSQSLIVQFIIFFTIGLTFFLLTGSFFKLQSDLIRRDILDEGTSLTADYLSSLSISAVDACKSCDQIEVTTNIKGTVGYSPNIRLDNGIVVSIEPENKLVQSSIHNLHLSLLYDTKEISSAKPITLTYDRTNNKLGIR